MNDPHAHHALPPELRTLAERAGIALDWHDYQGHHRTVAEGRLRQVLQALGHRCGTAEEMQASLRALAAVSGLPAMATGRVGVPLQLPVSPCDLPGQEGQGVDATLRLENGEERAMHLAVVVPAFHGMPAGLSLGSIDTPGYHRLEVWLRDRVHTLLLAIAPRRAYRVEDAAAARAGQGAGAALTPHEAASLRLWGTAVQLYALPPDGARPLTGADAGIGDFTALAAFARGAAAAGAHAVAISPTHAGFAANPHHFSPYAPSSRLFNNVLHIDPAAVFGAAAACTAARRADIEAELAALQAEPLIDWPRSGALKLRWLRALFDEVDDVDDDAAAGQAPGGAAPQGWQARFDRYRAELGEPLARHACFEALHGHFQSEGLSDWRQWPAAFQDPASEQVAAFARDHAREVRFHAFLQWLADEGLRAAQQAARDAGMAVGLVTDLAVGMDGAGSHAWSRPQDLLNGLEVGAPPDLLNTQGQTWGITAVSTRALAETAFAPFLATLRAAMRHAGGVRIDHVLGLNRLWLVPQGAPAGEGAYVHFPFDDLLNLLVLESHRHRVVVVGEDLGTVPDGLREKLADAGVLGMRVLWFERDPTSSHGAGFQPPQRWPRDAVAMTTTHDLPTAAGWWLAHDVDWRERIGIGSMEDAAAARAERARDRAALLRSWGEGRGGEGQGNGHAQDPGELPLEDAVDIAIDQVAATPAVLAIVPVEDLLGLREQPNLPGTVHQHPNWRRRLPLPADRLLVEPPAAARAERLGRMRPGPGAQGPT